MSSVTDCIYHPEDDHGETDHGCYASVGDLVELINPMGQRTGIHGLVQSEEVRKAIVPKRILYVYWIGKDGPSLEPYSDSFVRIISRS